MNTYQGFSLIEVLVALLLVTTISLTLLRQQGQTSQLFNQARMRSEALALLDNNSERMNARQPLSQVDKPFYLQQSLRDAIVYLQLGWHAIPAMEPPCCSLQRQIPFAP